MESFPRERRDKHQMAHDCENDSHLQVTPFPDYQRSNFFKAKMKYQDMKRTCTKVTYNIMGEPVTNEIDWGKRNRKRPRQSRQSAPASSSVCLTAEPPQANCMQPAALNNQTHVPSDAIRIIHVLREILFGKVIRDVMESRSSPHSTTLPEVLRFFCQTSFGVTTVATKRQTDLFHAILANQGSSSFLRVMKRLLHIPGIKPFDDKIATMYCEVWCWFIQNDALADVGSTGKVNVSLRNMLKCFEDLCSSNGNQFSPELLRSIEDAIKPQDLDCEGSANYEVLLDGDDALEKILNVVEHLDNDTSKLDRELFSEPEKTVLVNSGGPSADIGKFDSLDARLSSVKSFLRDCITLDKERRGILQRKTFVSVVIHWYELQYGILALPIDSVARLVNCFALKEEKRDGQIDYITFAGVLYTFMLEEEDRAPGPEQLMSYIDETYRGVDKHHLDCIKRYVENVRFKTTCCVKPSSYREKVIKSRRTISRIRPYGDSEFIGRWAVAPSSNVEHGIIANLYTSNASARRSIKKSSQSLNCRPKTPLHVVEPMSSVSVNIMPELLEKSCAKEINDESNSSSISKLEEKDNNVRIASGTNVYVRFPGVEPFRTPLTYEKIQMECNYLPSSSIEYGCKSHNVGEFMDKNQLSESESYNMHPQSDVVEREDDSVQCNPLALKSTSKSARSTYFPNSIPRASKFQMQKLTRKEKTKMSKSQYQYKDTKNAKSMKKHKCQKSPRSSQLSISLSESSANKTNTKEVAPNENLSTETEQLLPEAKSIYEELDSEVSKIRDNDIETVNVDSFGASKPCLKKLSVPEGLQCAGSTLVPVNPRENNPSKPELTISERTHSCSPVKDTTTKKSPIKLKIYGPQKPPDRVEEDTLEGEIDIESYLIRSIDPIPRQILTFTLPSLKFQGFMTPQQLWMQYHNITRASSFRITTKNDAVVSIISQSFCQYSNFNRESVAQNRFLLTGAEVGDKSIMRKQLTCEEKLVAGNTLQTFQLSDELESSALVPIIHHTFIRQGRMVEIDNGATSGNIEIKCVIDNRKNQYGHSISDTVSIHVGNICLVNCFDWAALFRMAESTLIEIVSEFSSRNHGVKLLLRQNDERLSGQVKSPKFTSKQIGKGSPGRLQTVGVKSLLLASRGRKYNGAFYFSNWGKHRNIRVIRPISYRVR